MSCQVTHTCTGRPGCGWIGGGLLPPGRIPRPLFPLVLLGSLCWPGLTPGAFCAGEDTVPAPQAEKTLAVREIASPPAMDGILPESEWPASSFVSGLIQLRPHNGEPAVADLYASVASDGVALYVAFRAPLYGGETPVASVTGRDSGSLASDEVIGLVIDTFGDGRSGFAFYFNALGTQGDIRVANDAETTDVTWDTQWEVATAVEDEAWTAEFMIPFSAIAYAPDLRSWGFNFGRKYPPRLEEAWWAGPVEKSFHVSRSGRLTGVPVPEPITPISFTPYLTARHAETAWGQIESGWQYDAGADIESDLGPQYTLNATLNPDFASVEGDREQINLSPFELSFPEKRRFFLEGNDLWRNRIQTFYTRRIGQIDAGAKLVGRTGRNTVAALAVREATLPDNPETAGDEYRPGATWGVVRLRRDILENSTIGLIGVNRHGPGGEAGALGSDLFLNLPGDWYITGQAIVSWPDPGLDTGAFFLRAEKKTDVYDYHLRYTELGERFRDNVNTVGFIRDDDRRELDAAASYTWYPRSGPFQFLEYDSNYNIYWSRTNGRLRNYEIRQSCDIYLRNDLSFEYEGEFESQEPDLRFDRHYFNRQHTFTLGYRTEEWASTSVSWATGEWQDCDLSLWEASINRQLVERLTASYSFIDLRLQPDPWEENAQIHIVRLEYAFTPDLYWRIFAQTNSGDDRMYLYSVLGWRYRPPFSAVYITWTRDEIIGSDPRPILFLKVSYQIGN